MVLGDANAGCSLTPSSGCPDLAPGERPAAESDPGLRGAGGAGTPARGLGCAAAPGPVQGGRALVQPPLPSRQGADWERGYPAAEGPRRAVSLSAPKGGLTFMCPSRGEQAPRGSTGLKDVRTSPGIIADFN